MAATPLGRHFPIFWRSSVRQTRTGVGAIRRTSGDRGAVPVHLDGGTVEPAGCAYDGDPAGRESQNFDRPGDTGVEPKVTTIPAGINWAATVM
jgi:hypothetical protein